MWTRGRTFSGVTQENVASVPDRPLPRPPPDKGGEGARSGETPGPTKGRRSLSDKQVSLVFGLQT